MHREPLKIFIVSGNGLYITRVTRLVQNGRSIPLSLVHIREAPRFRRECLRKKTPDLLITDGTILRQARDGIRVKIVPFREPEEYARAQNIRCIQGGPHTPDWLFRWLLWEYFFFNLAQHI